MDVSETSKGALAGDVESIPLPMNSTYALLLDCSENGSADEKSSTKRQRKDDFNIAESLHVAV